MASPAGFGYGLSISSNIHLITAVRPRPGPAETPPSDPGGVSFFMGHRGGGYTRLAAYA